MEKKEIVVAHIIGKWLGGGVESVVMNYYRHIDRTKIQFDFICDEDSTNIPYEEIEKLGGRVILIPPYQKLFKYHNKLKKILKDGNYKIVHSHINTLSIFSLFAAKCAGVPVRIAHSHSTTNKKEKKKNLLKQALRPFSKVFATNYMCCSELAGRWLFGNKEYDKGNVYLLNNAIDLDKFKYDEKIRSEKRKKLNISDDTLVIGHVGRFVEQKNHRFLIDIFNEIHKQNSNSILLLAGQGPLMEEIKSKVESLGLEEFVIFLGQRNDIDELYQVFDVFCLPSLYEGLPVVGVEAQATGLLCELSSDMTKETKVLDTTRFISLEKTPEEWAKTILEDYSKFKRNDTTEEITKNNFNIKKEALKLEEVYNELLSKKINICHVVSAMRNGGAETFILNYSKYLPKGKFNLHILYQYEPNKDCLNRFLNLGFKVYQLPSKKTHPFCNYIKTKKYLLKNNIDVVHCHMTMGNIIPLLASNSAKIKLRICHAHECEKVEKNTLKFYLYNIIRKICTKCSNKYVACGIEAGNFMFQDKDFEILNNAIDLDKFKFQLSIRNKLRKKFNYLNGDIIIGHIGRFVDVKNHAFILKIIKPLISKNHLIKLILIGDGELFDSINQKVIDEKLQNNVRILHSVGNVNEFYNLMDAFILPSKREGLPFVALEAQANGLNCFISNKVDKNVLITKKSKLMPLKEKIWIDDLKKITNDLDRKINIDDFETKHLNVQSEIEKLIKIYEENYYE